jgi:cytochrome c oxidase subunit IV
MKRFKKILKWTLITIVTIIAGISITVAMRQNMKYEALTLKFRLPVIPL